MKRVYIAGLSVALLLTATAAVGSAQAGTDIYVVSITGTGSAMRIGVPRNLTKRAGYDNQPFFTPDGRAVLFTSRRGDDQSDIYRVDVATGAETRLTDTPESEYSATPTLDGEGFTVIRVERDSAQRLWKFPWGSGTPRVVLPALKPVGYHVWVSEGALGAFVLASSGDRHWLALANPLTERVDTLGRNIGRAFAKVPGRDAFSFVRMADSGTGRSLGEVDVRTRAVLRRMPLPDGAEFHVWTRDGTLITSSGSKLYVWVDGRWDTLADFGAFGIRNMNRLALSPDGTALAFVAADGAP